MPGVKVRHVKRINKLCGRFTWLLEYLLSHFQLMFNISVYFVFICCQMTTMTMTIDWWTLTPSNSRKLTLLVRPLLGLSVPDHTWSDNSRMLNHLARPLLKPSVTRNGAMHPCSMLALKSNIVSPSLLEPLVPDHTWNNDVLQFNWHLR